MMNRISILMVLILILSLGCAPQSSIEDGNSVLPKAEQPSTENLSKQDVQIVKIPSLNDEETANKGEKDVVQAEIQEEKGETAPHIYEDATPPPPAPEVPSVPARVGVGLAWFVGGFLVLHVGAKAENALFRLNQVYLKLLPAMAREEQLKIGKTVLGNMANNMERLAQKFGLRQKIAEKLAARIIVTRSAMGLFAKRGLTSLLGQTIGLVKWVSPIMWGIGLVQIVLDPTEAGGAGDELGPQDRFDFLKHAIEELEKNPHDVHLQDRVITSTINYLYDVINMLEYESNQTCIAHAEVRESKDTSDQDKEATQKEFEEFWVEQDSLIEYFKTTAESLKEIYYVEGSDRSKAEAILQKTMPKLEAILAKQK